MASLTGTKIKNTYDGLLKTTDNEPLDGTLRTITDGLGNNSTISLSTSAADIGGTLSVQGATSLYSDLSVVGDYVSASGDISLANGDFIIGGIIYAASNITHLGDNQTNLEFATGQFKVNTGGLPRLSVTDASTQVTNPLIASSTLTVTGNYNSINGDISLSNGKIAVGGSVSIANSIGTASFSSDANLLVIGDTGAGANQGMTIVSPTTSTGNIYFANGTTGNQTYRGYVKYDHNINKMFLGVNATDIVTIDSASANVTGNLVASGSITGGNINASSLSSGDITLSGAIRNSANPLSTYLAFPTSTSFTLITNGSTKISASSGGVGLSGVISVGGTLVVDGDTWTNGKIMHTDDLNTYIDFPSNDNISLVTGGSQRLGVSDAGASVTGTLAVSGNAAFDTNTLFVDAANNKVGVNTNTPAEALEVYNAHSSFGSRGANSNIYVTSGLDGSNYYAGRLRTDFFGSFSISTGSVPSENAPSSGSLTERIKINSGGDISFRDSSANEAFYWDASAASLGIGGTPSYPLDVFKSSASQIARFNFGNTNGGSIQFATNGVTKGYIGTAYHLVIPAGSANDIAISSLANLVFVTGGATEKMRIDSSGNVGIGTDNPQFILSDFSSSARGLAISNTYPFLGLNDSDGGKFFVGTQANIAYIWNNGTDSMIFGTNAAERMRIASGGRVLIGQTTELANQGSLQVSNGQTGGPAQYSARNTSYSSGNYNYSFGMNSSGDFVVYLNPAIGGNIGVYLSAGATSWTANSDERLKDITGTIDNAIDSVNQLRPVFYTLKADNQEEKINDMACMGSQCCIAMQCIRIMSQCYSFGLIVTREMECTFFPTCIRCSLVPRLP